MSEFYFTDPRTEDQYQSKHVWWPKSLAEQDVEWDREDRLRRQAAARAESRVRP